MNKKGAFGFLIVLTLLAFVFVFWALFLGDVFNSAGQAAVDNGASGIEAFFWTNLNLVFFFCFLLAIVAAVYFNG